MTDIPNIDHRGPQTWHLSLADWGHLDTVWERQLPFALWNVGEQALIFHWLDAAVDQGTERIVLYVADRPDQVRKMILSAKLWPIEVEIQTLASIDSVKADDCVNRLPRSAPLTKDPEAGWGLIQYWHQIEQQWLQNFAEETKAYGIYAAIGRSCEIAADVQLIPPFWLGNHISIGPGAVIGPMAVIEDGCIVAGNNRIERAHVGAHTYLGPETELVDAAIHRNDLLNFKRQAYVKGLESFLAGSMQSQKELPQAKAGWRDRLRALRLYFRYRKRHGGSTDTFQGIDGHAWPVLKSRALDDRLPWLRLVIKGEMPLFGVTPRRPEDLIGLPDEWGSILKKAAVGAFSYADVMGAPDPGDMDEALHCVYQTNDSDGRCRELFNHWIEEQLDTPISKLPNCRMAAYK